MVSILSEKLRFTDTVNDTWFIEGCVKQGCELVTSGYVRVYDVFMGKEYYLDESPVLESGMYHCDYRFSQFVTGGSSRKYPELIFMVYNSESREIGQIAGPYPPRPQQYFDIKFPSYDNLWQLSGTVITERGIPVSRVRVRIRSCIFKDGEFIKTLLGVVESDYSGYYMLKYDPYYNTEQHNIPAISLEIDAYIITDSKEKMLSPSSLRTNVSREQIIDVVIENNG
jgi:hypothetical protein